MCNGLAFPGLWLFALFIYQGPFCSLNFLIFLFGRVQALVVLVLACPCSLVLAAPIPGRGKGSVSGLGSKKHTRATTTSVDLILPDFKKALSRAGMGGRKNREKWLVEGE